MYYINCPEALQQRINKSRSVEMLILPKDLISPDLNVLFSGDFAVAGVKLLSYFHSAI